MSGVEAVLGVASAGAGLLSLAVQLGDSIQKLKAFRDSVQSSSETIRALIFDLETMALCLDQLERYRSQDQRQFELVSRCLERCSTALGKIRKAIGKLQTLTARYSRLAKFYAAFKEPETAKLLIELEQAKSSLSVSLVMFYSEQQANHNEMQRGIMQQQSTQLDLIWTGIQANNFAVSQISKRSAEHTHSASSHGGVLPRRSSYGRTPNYETYEEAQHDPRLTKRKHPRQKTVAICFPRWLCSQVWNVSAIQARAGWDLKLRTYLVRHPNSEIFRRCIAGDVKAVQKMISHREASIRDVARDYVIWNDISQPNLIGYGGNYNLVQVRASPLSNICRIVGTKVASDRNHAWSP